MAVVQCLRQARGDRRARDANTGDGHDRGGQHVQGSIDSATEESVIAPAPAPHAVVAMPAGQAAVVTLGLVILLAGFIVIGSLLGLAPLYAGFLLLWFFGSVDALDLAALPALAAGAVAGTGTAWLLQAWGPAYDGAVALAVLMLIIVAVFLNLMGRLPLLLNRAYFLYLTIMAAPVLQLQERFAQVVLTIVAATVYFGGIVLIGKKLGERRAATAAARMRMESPANP
jgi:hypothetical protein